MTDREKLRALVEKWRTEKNNTADDPRVAAAFNAGLRIAAMELESALPEQPRLTGQQVQKAINAVNFDEVGPSAAYEQIADLLSAPQAEQPRLTKEQVRRIFNEQFETAMVDAGDYRAATKCGLNAVCTLLSAPATPAPAAPEVDLERAPANHLPSWKECKLIIENYEFRQRAKAGLEGAVLDTPPTTPEPTAIHRFIYEYDDADSYRSEWFMHRLELALIAHDAKVRRGGVS